MRIPFLILGFAIWFLSACSEGSTMTEPEPMSTDEIVEGVNITQVFAPPTQAEIDQVLADWNNRNPVAANVNVVTDSAIMLHNVPATLQVVSHTVGGVLHYGLIAAPDGAAANSLPVLIYTHGGDGGIDASEFLVIVSTLDSLADQFVFVAPAYRDESIRMNGVTYQSQGPASPWDYDVDDTMALLTVALENTPAADAEKVGMLGFSRGGAVALLTSIRDPRIDVVVEFFGPTDFFGDFVKEVAIEALMGMPRSLPGIDYTNDNIILPLQSGNITQEAARLEMVRRSPVYFAESIPRLQVHHGALDTTVPVGEAERLIEVMQGLGRTSPEFESFIYEAGTHHPLTMDGSIPRGVEYLSWLLNNTILF